MLPGSPASDQGPKASNRFLKLFPQQHGDSQAEAASFVDELLHFIFLQVGLKSMQNAREICFPPRLGLRCKPHTG